MLTLSCRTARATVSGSDLPDGLATASLGVHETTAEVHKGGVTGGRGGDAGNAQCAKDADPDHRTESNRRSHHVTGPRYKQTQVVVFFGGCDKVAKSGLRNRGTSKRYLKMTGGSKGSLGVIKSFLINFTRCDK
jgi:hypothetical protein